MPPHPDLALALVRIATGSVFVAHGWSKIVTAGLGGVTRAYAASGVPLPLLVAPVTATLELLGGALLVLGLGARGLAGVLGGVTLAVGALRFAHGALPGPAVETAVLLVAGCAAVLLAGPGRPGVDGWAAPGGRARARR